MVCEAGEVNSIFFARYRLRLFAFFDVEDVHGLIVGGADEEFALVIEVKGSYARFGGFVLREVGELLLRVSHEMDTRRLDSSGTLDGRNVLITSVTFCVLGWLAADGGVSAAGTAMMVVRRR